MLHLIPGEANHHNNDNRVNTSEFTQVAPGMSFFQWHIDNH